MVLTGNFDESMKSLSEIEKEVQKYLSQVRESDSSTDETEATLLHQTLQALHDANELLNLAGQSNRELASMMISLNRQASMGEMIGNIAHQWRQPLHALGLIAETLRDAGAREEMDGEFVNKSVDQIMNLILYMSRTIDDFSNYFKPDREMKSFDLEESVKKALTLVKDSFKTANITVKMEVSDHLIITGYPHEYAQAVLNILNNAREAFLERKTTLPRVTIRLFREGKRAVAAISDNAGGISDEILGRVFEPYLTTKEAMKGSGLGLYITKTIIENRMHGSISVRNVGEGAEFRVEI